MHTRKEEWNRAVHTRKVRSEPVRKLWNEKMVGGGMQMEEVTVSDYD